MSHKRNLTNAGIGADATPLSRRELISTSVRAIGGVAISGALMWAIVPLAKATIASAPAATDRFMKASCYLIQHRLSASVGLRLAAILGSLIPTLDADLEVIIRVAQEKHATAVEEFFGALPEGRVTETAHQIIFGWYAGVVDEGPGAEVFAYEEALMYQPAKDAVALPTYSFNGPDNWTEIDPPLSAMPDF